MSDQKYSVPARIAFWREGDGAKTKNNRNGEATIGMQQGDDGGVEHTVAVTLPTGKKGEMLSVELPARPLMEKLTAYFKNEA